MKRYFFLTAVLALFFPRATYSQAIGSFDDFVIGAFNFYYPGSASTGDQFTAAIDAAGVNAIYNGYPSLYGSLDPQRTGYPGFNFENPLGLPPANDPHNLDYLGGGKSSDLISTDVRFFLASNAGNRSNPEIHGQTNPSISNFSYDLYYSWRTAKGGRGGTQVGIPAVDRSNEWYIPLIGDGNPIIENLQVNGNSVNNDGRSSYLVAPGTTSIYCDFIFAIDKENDYKNFTGQNNIYNVVYSVKRTGSGGAFIQEQVRQINFTKSDPNSYETLSSNSHWTSDHSRIKFYNNQTYAVQFTTIPRSNANGNVISIECKLLETTDSHGIYVRGLRIRSETCDNLLRGLYNNYDQHSGLYQRFTEIKNTISAVNSAWDKTRAFATGTEYDPPTHRALAYIDKIWKKWSGGKRITTFLDNNNDFYWFDAICRDEEEDIDLPPYFMSECEGHWNITNVAQYGNDGQDATSPSANPIGYPQDVIPKSRRPHYGPNDVKDPILKDFTLFGAPVQDYDSYTSNYQKRIGACKKSNEAVSSKGPSGTVNAPWYGGIWANMDFASPEDPNNPTADSRFTRQGSQLDAILTDAGEIRSFRDQFIQDIKNGICHPEVQLYDMRQLVNMNPLNNSSDPANKHGLGSGTTWNVGDPSIVGTLVPNNPDPTKLVTLADGNTVTLQYHGGGGTGDPLNALQWRLDTRSPTGPELRLDAWDVICHGGKGVFWNAFGTDLGENIGVTSSWGHANDWWNDDPSLPSGKKGLFLGNIRIGAPTNPLLPVNKWDRFKIQRQAPPGTAVGSDWIEFIGGNWPSCIATDMTNLINSGSTSNLTLAQSIVDNYVQNNSCSGINLNGLIYGTQIKYVPEVLNGSWAGFLQPNNGATGDCSYDWTSFHWADWTSSIFSAWAPTFYGFKERFSGVQNFANDLRPLAKVIPNLQWVSCIENTGDLLKNNTSGSANGELDDWNTNFPISISNFVSSKFDNQKDNFSYDYDAAGQHEITINTDAFTLTASTQYDANGEIKNAALYEMALYNDKTSSDSHTKYVSIVNRRTWPVYYKPQNGINKVKQFSEDNTNNDHLLGPVDCRRLSFRINRDIIDPNHIYTKYSVTNLKTGIENIVAINDNITADFEPAEGTIFRISPAYSFSGGRTDDKGMAYNNGHRITEITAGNNTPPIRVMTWEENGNIMYNIDNNDNTISGLDNFVQESGAQTLNGQACQNQVIVNLVSQTIPSQSG
jgi:hypothetical protein